MKQEKIGLKIKELRKQRNLTQTDLAKSLGYSDKSVISHIEKGDADMTYEKILLLLRTYAIDANDLFEVERIDRKLEDWKKSRGSNMVNSHPKSCRVLTKKEFRDNIDYYCNLVFEAKQTIMVKLDDGNCFYVKPADENEIR